MDGITPGVGGLSPDHGVPRSLLHLLKAGDVISARVEAALGNDLYALTMRGRTLVAESVQGLFPDQVVRLVVEGSGPQMRLRLAAPGDGPVKDPVAARLAALGLPDDDTAQAVVDTFIDADAPLDVRRLRVALAAGPQLFAAHARVAAAGLPNSAAWIGLAAAAPAGLPDSAGLLRAGVTIPDVDVDGSEAVLRALVAVGQRVAEAAPSPLLPTLIGPDAPAASHAAARELAAASILPPRDLVEYDQVFALPLMHQGQPTPARLAVAKRTATGGATATYVRVDVELSRLGPLSIRLAGMPGATTAITIASDPRALADLTAMLPGLRNALMASGLTTAVRVIEADHG